jgi:hypothetical protein
MTAYYRIAGLTVRSALRLPAMAAPPTAPVDVTVMVDDGDQAPVIADAVARGRNWAMGPWGQGVGRGMVTGATGGVVHLSGTGAITVWGRNQEQRDEAADWVVSAAFAAVLLARGRLPLHAAALSFGDRALMVAGVSGAGKSTLAAALAGAGGVVIADDLSAPAPGADGAMILEPVFPRLRLAPGAAAMSGRSVAPTVLADGKQRLPADDSLRPGPRQAAALLIIDGRSSGAGEMVRIAAADAVGPVLSHIVGRQVMDRFGTMPALWSAASMLCRNLPVYSLHPPDRLDSLAGFAEGLAADLVGRCM